MADGCLVVVMDDDVPIHRMVQKILRPSDVVAPWHVRSPGGSTPCNYLFIRPEPPLTEADESFVKWNTTAQAELLLTRCKPRLGLLRSSLSSTQGCIELRSRHVSRRLAMWRVGGGAQRPDHG